MLKEKLSRFQCSVDFSRFRLWSACTIVYRREFIRFFPFKILQYFLSLQIKSFSTKNDETVNFSVGSSVDLDTVSGSDDQNNSSNVSENIFTVDEVNVFENASEPVDKEEITTLSSDSLEFGETSSSTASNSEDLEPVTDVAITTNVPDQDITKKLDEEISNELD